MKKCIVFCRVSTNHQELENQRNKVVASAMADGYTMDEIAIVEGKESAIKLKEEERETIKEMKSLIDQFQTIESVYVFAIDRLARRVSVILSVKDYLMEKGVNLVFLNPHKMSTLRTNEKGEKVEDELTSLLLMLLSYGADMEMKVKKERFKTVKDAMRKNGQITEAVVMVGYKKGPDKKAVIDDETAPHIIKAFQRYANENVSLGQLSKELCAIGLFSTSESTRINRMFHNLAYSGRDGNKYPALIDAETQDRCIEKMSQNKVSVKTTSKNIYYARCLVRNIDGQQLRLNRPNNQYGGKEQGIQISTNVVDTVAWLEASNLYKLMLTDDVIAKKEGYKKTIEENEKKVAHCQKMIEESELKKSRAFKMYVAGKVGENDYTETVNDIDKDIAKWEKELAKINADTTLLQQKLDVEDTNPFTVDYVGEVEDDVMRRHIVEQTIERILVTKEGRSHYHIYVTPKKELEWAYNRLSKNEYEYIFKGGGRQILEQHCVADENVNSGKTIEVPIIKRFMQHKQQ